MARRAKDAAQPVEGANGPPKTPEDIFNEHFPQIKAAKMELEKAQSAASTANSTYRNYLKSFKKAGGDSDALIMALADQKLDPNDVNRKIANYNRYARLMGMPIGTQFGLFTDGQTVATKVDNGADKSPATERMTDRMRTAINEDGFKAGFNGRNLDTNPYEDGSPDFLAWSAGWNEAQAARAQSMGPQGAQPAAQA